MENLQNKLTAQESLNIITSMINLAKGNARRHSYYFLLWGWVAVIANLGMYVLLLINYNRPYLIWLIAIPAWGLSMYRGYRYRQKETFTTHLDRIVMGMWLSFTLCVVTIIFFGSAINYQINPLVLIFCAVPTFATGLVLRFKPLLIGGIALWLFSIADFLVPREYQNLVAALALVFGYLVPGYILRSRKTIE